MGLVKVEMQIGHIEGEADKHNKFQFFTKLTLVLDKCSAIVIFSLKKQYCRENLPIRARNHEYIIISLFSKVAGKRN